MEKRKLPDINPLGFAGDYINEVSPLFSAIENLTHYKQDIFHKLNPIQKYIERFPPDQYEAVINEQNKDKLPELDEIVDTLNQMLEQESRDIGVYNTLIARVYAIIWGRDIKTREKIE